MSTTPSSTPAPVGNTPGSMLAAGAASLDAGRVGAIEIRGSEIILGEPIRFTKANIDRFDF